MSLRERNAGAALEIPLERKGPAFVAKSDHDVQIPRAISGCVTALACVVRRKTLPDVGCAAGVKPARFTAAAKDVYKALEGRHGVPGARVVPRAPVNCRPNRTNSQGIRQLALPDGNLGCGSPPPHAWRRATEDTILRAVGGWTMAGRGLRRACHPKRAARRAKDGGPDRDRTGDLLNAIQARSQLRYRPFSSREEPLF